MTDVIDFNKWKEDKESKNKAKFIWHSFPYFLDDTFNTGDILVKKICFNDETKKIETNYFFPTRESIEMMYNNLNYCNDGDYEWMDKETLHKILSQYDDNDIIG